MKWTDHFCRQPEKASRIVESKIGPNARGMSARSGKGLEAAGYGNSVKQTQPDPVTPIVQAETCGETDVESGKLLAPPSGKSCFRMFCCCCTGWDRFWQHRSCCAFTMHILSVVCWLLALAMACWDMGMFFHSAALTPHMSV